MGAGAGIDRYVEAKDRGLDHDQAKRHAAREVGQRFDEAGRDHKMIESRRELKRMMSL